MLDGRRRRRECVEDFVLGRRGWSVWKRRRGSEEEEKSKSRAEREAADDEKKGVHVVDDVPNKQHTIKNKTND